MAKIWVPAGKVPTKPRSFHIVAADVRHTVFSVQRFRPRPDGLYDITPIGSGFFVTSEAFVTCCHVINGSMSPHKEGDLYRLVNNLDGEHGIVHEINGGVGKDIHLFPDDDLAILISKSKKDQAFLPVSYADLAVGAPLGVAGYPLGQLSNDAMGNLTLKGIIYRVSQAPANAVYRTDLSWKNDVPLKDVTVVEVNFLFVPGNSGGPIFDAETGRALAYVKGFRYPKIIEMKETCNLIPVPDGMNGDYMSAIYAVYSVGLTLDRVRKHLEKFGVQL